MKSKAWMFLPMLAAGLLLVTVATESLGQSYRETKKMGNSRRDAGGSCVYDKYGKLVFAPDGKDCRDGTDHLSKTRTTDLPVVAGYPPSVQGELAELLGDHDHIFEEIARLRRSVESRNVELALKAVDKIRAELTDHRAREERFFEKMAPNPTSP